MHHIYKTKGIILSDFDRGESNKVYIVLTRDFGVLAVYAQGVRELKSKLVYSLQLGTFLNLDMVKGKNVWRVTNAKYENNLLKYNNKRFNDFVHRIFSFIRRLTHGEEKNEKLFDTVLHFLEFDLVHLGVGLPNEGVDELLALEIILNLQILHALGYGTLKKELEPFLNGEVNMQILSDFNQYKKLAINEINTALKESHL